MYGGPRTLRVSIRGLRVQDARKYQMALQVQTAGHAAADVIMADETAANTLRPDMMARTEVTGTTRNPDFLNRVFVLRLPQTLLRSSAKCAAVLHCQLFAVPTLDTPPRPLTPGGKEQDDLMGSASIDLKGDLTARLIRGECIPVTLSLDSDQEAGFDRRPGNPLQQAKQEIMLDLMLLDAEPASNSFARASAPSALPFTATSGLYGGMSPAEESSPAKDPAMCQLMCLVSRAEGLPKLTGDGGQKAAPSVFVAAKMQKDAVARRPAQAITRIVEQSCNPVWNQVLTVQFEEAAASHEALLLALVNDESSKILARCSIPVKSLRPDCHYNLKLQLGPEGASSSPSLFVTLCLTKSPEAALRTWQQLQVGNAFRLDVRLAGAAAPLLAGDGFSDVGLAAVWRLEPDAKAAEQLCSTTTADSMHKPVRSTDEALISAAISGIDRASQGNSPGIVMSQALPIGSAGAAESGQDDLLWPASHMVSLGMAGQVSQVAALVLELHRWPCSEPGSRVGSANAADKPAAASPGNVGSGGPASTQPAGSEGAADRTSKVDEDEDDDDNEEDEEDDEDDDDDDDDDEEEKTPTGKLAKPLQAKPGKPLQAAKAITQPAQKAASPHAPRSASFLAKVVIRLADLPTDRTGNRFTITGKLLHTSNSASIAMDAAEEKTLAQIELRMWDAASYVQYLQRELASDSEALPLQGRAAAAAWGNAFSGSKTSAQNQTMTALLVDDLVTKQTALERLQRSLSHADSSAELAVWRIHDLTSRNKALAADVQQMRKLVHEERQSHKGVPNLAGLEALSREEMIDKAVAAVQAYGREKRRNTELVHRLQQMHMQILEGQECQQRFVQLQEAHTSQAKLLAEIDGSTHQIPQLRQAAKAQEKVIAQLEKLLKSAVAERKAISHTAEDRRTQIEMLEASVADLEQQVARVTAENTHIKGLNNYEEVERIQNATKTEIEAVRRQAADEVASVREQTTSELETLRAQCRYDLESAHAAKGEEIESIRRQKNAEIEGLREQKNEELEALRNQRLADLDALRGQLMNDLEQLRAQKAAELEGVKAQLMGELEALRSSRDLEANMLRSELGGQLDAVRSELEALQMRLDAAKSSEEYARKIADDFDSERLAATLKAEKAEASAIAAQNELLEVTKRYAREIAHLKTRLAEKDAQLMGGFGSVANLMHTGGFGSLLDPNQIAASLSGFGGGKPLTAWARQSTPPHLKLQPLNTTNQDAFPANPKTLQHTGSARRSEQSPKAANPANTENADTNMAQPANSKPGSRRATGEVKAAVPEGNTRSARNTAEVTVAAAKPKIAAGAPMAAKQPQAANKPQPQAAKKAQASNDTDEEDDDDDEDEYTDGEEDETEEEPTPRPVQKAAPPIANAAKKPMQPAAIAAKKPAAQPVFSEDEDDEDDDDDDDAEEEDESEEEPASAPVKRPLNAPPRPANAAPRNAYMAAKPVNASAAVRR